MNKQNKTKYFFPDGKGFTLIELLVAVSIFIIVVTVVFSLFSSAIKGQRRVMAMQNIQENARFIFEFMAKEIRMSKINSGNATSLNITRSDGNVVNYVLSDAKIYRDNIQVNSDVVSVTGSFYVDGVGADGEQPKITIALKVQGIGSRPEEQAFINVQTTISQRILDSSDL